MDAIHVAGQGWVKNIAPWLWPVLRDSLEVGGLNAFLDHHKDSFWWEYDYEKNFTGSVVQSRVMLTIPVGRWRR